MRPAPVLHRRVAGGSSAASAPSGFAASGGNSAAGPFAPGGLQQQRAEALLVGGGGRGGRPAFGDLTLDAPPGGGPGLPPHPPGGGGMLLSSAGGAARDRTADFLQIAERLRKQQATTSGGDASAADGAAPLLGSRAALGALRPAGAAGGYLPAPGAAAGGPAGPQSEFTRRAAGIGLGIHATSQKLQRLAALAKRTSMFDDPAAEIAELTGGIKGDIQALNGAIGDLQSISDARTKQGSEHTARVVENLKSKLMGATKDFKDVLTLRTESLKQHDSRRSLFSGGGARPGGGGGGGGGGGRGNSLFGGRASKLAFSGDGGLPTHHRGSAGAGPSGSDPQQQQQQQQMQLQLSQGNDAYLASRQAALQNVEKTIAELGGIFLQLRTMVAEQGELAVRIDENLEDTLANVDSAQGQLQKYLDSISSNRWLILKIFGVLMAFLIFFIVFVA